MRRLALLMAVFLIASSVAISAVPADTSPRGTGEPEAIGVLTIDTETRTEYSTQSLNVAAAVGTQQQATKALLNQYAFAAAFAEAESEGARRAVLLSATREIEYQIDTLEARDQRLRARYANGSIDAATYVRGLARIDQEARQLATYLDQIHRAAAQVPQPGVNPDIRRLRTELIGLTGPVRGQIVLAIEGANSPARIYVDAAAHGVVVAVIDSGRHIREATRMDYRSPEVDPSFDLDSAVSRSRELYPEAFNESISTGVRFLGVGRYQLDITLGSGSITAFLDSGTRQVFYERQNHELAPTEDAPVAVTTDNGIRVAVNRTYPGGPLRVAVTDAETGEPQQSVVEVDGHRVETDLSGVAWTLGPTAREFSVTAVTDSGNVSLTVRPIQPPDSTN